MINPLPRKKWQILLLAGAAVISIFFLYFTNYLVNELSRDELAKVHRIAAAFEILNDPEIEDYTQYLEIIQEADIPFIQVDEQRNIIFHRNLNAKLSKDTAYIKRQLWLMGLFNKPVKIEREGHYVYYKEQQAITLLRIFPFLQLLLISVFLTISYVAFNTNRRYEQNKVWVGLAKETAHQIGTPLSSLIAWLEYLKTSENPPENEVLIELEKDVQRLEIITERFSKIGSTPDLTPQNTFDLLSETVDYMAKRLSKKVIISINEESETVAYADINKPLFSWVIENILKNAVDAMVGDGRINFHLFTNKRNIIIDISDTGKGIPRNMFDSIFEPGFTTKKRGWGLGLSLSKRIIENYHRGELFVKESEVGIGTTFRIKLKRSNT